jgi:hypothetical protein
VRQCHVGDGGVEHLHKCADGHDNSDDPGIECLGLRKALIVEFRSDIRERLLNVCNFLIAGWLRHKDSLGYLK